MNTTTTSSAKIFVSKNYLRKQNMSILDTEWRCKGGVIDIVAKDEDSLVFVEVKPIIGSDEDFTTGAPTPEKRSQYEAMATEYLLANPLSDMPIRFDDIEIKNLDGNRAMVRHHVNALGCA